MPKNILFNADARAKIIEGIRIMKEAVGCTMGPDGQTMLIDKGRFNRPVASKDGVTVAKHVKLSDPEQAMGADILFEASSRTNDTAGDGTTCAVVLGAAMIEEGLKHVVAGRNVNKMRRGILRGSAAVVERLQEIATPIETTKQIEQIATISSQDPAIGKTLSEVMENIGSDGTITVDIKQSSPGMEWEVLEGMQVERGYSSQIFSTDERKAEYNMENVLVLITSDPIMRQQQIVPMIDLAVRNGMRNILIIAPHLDAGSMGSPAAFLLTNKLQGKLVPVFVKAPENGQHQLMILNDIAVYTNAKFFSGELNQALPEGVSAYEKDPNDGTEAQRKDVDMSFFGVAERVIVTSEKTSIIGGKFTKKRMESTLAEIRGAIGGSSDNFQKEFFRERLGNLTSGVGVIRVAASTEFESDELRLRVDDALASVRSAVHEGVLPGGGVALLRCLGVLEELMQSCEDDDERVGLSIVHHAIQTPAWQIATVSGEKGDWIVGKILEEEKNPNFGFDSAAKLWGDMVKMGIIDPKRAIRCALENATSVAATFLTMHGTITDIPEPQPVERAMNAKARAKLAQ